MKTTLLILLFAVASSCGSSAGKQENQETEKEPPVVTEPVTEAPAPQEQEKEEIAAKRIQNSMLIGEIEKKDFLSPPFDQWFNSNFDNYSPAHEEMEKIKNGLSEVDKIRVYMGTWCPDSRRETPKLFKILDLADFDLSKVEMMAVDRSKTAPDDSHETYNIRRVPTIIFYKNGEEMDRFVERPRETFEKDIAKIVSGEEYKHSYEN